MTQTDTSIRRLAEALQKQLNASVGCFDVKCEGCQREIALIESALTTLATSYEQDIKLFWDYVSRAYDIEPREYFEKEARTNGFQSPLAQAAHHIWKRDPNVKEIAQQIREEDARIAEQELNYWLIDGHAAAKRIAAAIRARQEKS